MTLHAGEVRQAGSGSVTDRTRQAFENRSAVTITAGSLVMPHSSGAGIEAWTGVRPALGITTEEIQAGLSGNVQTAGYLTLSWSLTQGARYYASNVTPGAITDTAPTSAGAIVQEVGVAASTATLEIEIGPEITL